MKILHVCNNYGPLYQNLINQQKVLGVNPSIFVYSTRKKEPPRTISDGEVIFFNSTIRFLRTPLFFRTRIDYVGKKFLDIYKDCHDFDLIHAHMLYSDGEMAFRAYKEFGIPYIVTIRNTDLNSWYLWGIPWNRKRGFEILTKASNVIFLSPAYQRRLLGKVPFNLGTELIKKSIVVPNGIDDFWHRNSITQPKEVPKGVINLLTVGRVEKNKNQSSVLRAVELLIEKGFRVKYSVVGEIIDKKMGRNLNSSKCVEIIPPCSQIELVNAYRNADIFVLPSIHESFGLVYAEAMSQGLPLVYSKGEGFDCQFPEGVVGIPVSAMNVKEISEAVLKVLNSYEQMSSNCISYSEKFKWELIAQKYFQIYSEIIG